MSEAFETRARWAETDLVRQSVLIPRGCSNEARWHAGERLHHLFERRCAALGGGDMPALEVDGVRLTFSDLDRRANQMARYFQSQGLGAGDRIGLIVDRSVDAYVALLAALKIDAAYVPLDVKFPSDRIAFIADDAGIKAFVTTVAAGKLVADLGRPVLDLETAAQQAALQSDVALRETQRSLPADQLCYIIYTSGSTGRPKGVAVNHSSICNFVIVAAESYGYQPGDRVYQGMTLAFDFSVEELWVPLLSGATLVPSRADRQMVGADLAAFLAEQRITAMCCVPTLLATIEDDLPALRLLLVSGEACPPDIVARWHRPGRRMLNAYGPTEATVTATWTEVEPDKPVTIGVPLPTYTVAMLHTTRAELVETGTVGEIAIGGIGLAQGYVNRDDLTAKAFVPDFLDLQNNPSHRLYRTGDLGRINEEGEIEYLGRIDAQVKIRGYRIELAEIENVLLEVEGIAQAVVTTCEQQPGLVELAAYYTCFEAGPKPSRNALLQMLRRRLPGYMVPAYLEELARIPLLASHKADRKALPAPSGMRLVARSDDFIAPRNDLERTIAACLAETMSLEAVSVDDHFFDDLGAHSLLMGQFVAALNARLPNCGAAISDVYLAPSVALLAQVIEARALKPTAERRKVGSAHIASDFEYRRCGALQAAFYAGQYAFFVGMAWWAMAFISAGQDVTDLAVRSVIAAAASLAVMLAMPIAVKWLVVGKWREESIPLWSVRYFRFWIVQHVTSFSPWLAFRGTALFNVYLRLLGARIGDGAIILTEQVPLATDLLDVGDYAVLRKHSHASGYRAENGRIEIGAISIGRLATVGERGLLDLGTTMGDDAQLGHASALLEGQSIPPGKRYHGSPAIETDTEFRYLPHAKTTWARRTMYAGARLVSAVGALATGLFIVNVLFHWSSSAVTDAPAKLWLPVQVMVGSFVLFLSGYALTAVAHLIVPRLLRLLLLPGKVYRLYGIHHYAAQMIATMGFSQRLQTLFGDSSAIVHYLKWAGVKQPEIRQTGSNFGTTMTYDSPFEVEVGSGSMVSDGLSIVNMEMGSGSFRIAQAKIGANSFLGNLIVYPSGARIGDNCLLGTKVMLPIDGKVRSNVGLLGSPCFEIPREVATDQRFDPVPSTAQGYKRLRDKNAYNFRTAILHLASQWMALFGVMFIAAIAAYWYEALGEWAAVAGAAVVPFWLIAHVVVAERLSLSGLSVRAGNRTRMVAHHCTIHEPYFWRVERHWKLGETFMKRIFTGTPFRPMLLRCIGLQVGTKVFDDGAMIAEKALVEIGDNCCINAASSIQGHSLEDGLFKSERVVIGNNCTIGPFGFVHYGVQMADNTVLSSDAFLMKGGRTERASYWQGNPARVV